jgi:hypothetical protein
MTDTYQAIYDAVRSKIWGGGDIGEVVRDVTSAAFDISHQRATMHQEIYTVSLEYQRPSAVFRPAISIDGNMWCALYGDNLHDGVAGFGDTPDKAMREFDKAWHEKLSVPPRAGAA